MDQEPMGLSRQAIRRMGVGPSLQGMAMGPSLQAMRSRTHGLMSTSLQALGPWARKTAQTNMPRPRRTEPKRTRPKRAGPGCEGKLALKF